MLTVEVLPEHHERWATYVAPWCAHVVEELRARCEDFQRGLVAGEDRETGNRKASSPDSVTLILSLDLDPISRSISMTKPRDDPSRKRYRDRHRKRCYSDPVLNAERIH